MQHEKFPINRGPSESFLIFDDALGIHTDFYEYLRAEGFTLSYPSYGSYDIKHCYVNITRRQYSYGKGGVQLCMPIGNASITIDEFKTVWAIYKRHIEAGECFSHADAPYVYQSPAVLEKRRKYEEDQRRMAEMRKNAKPATPEEIEQLLKEFPDDAYDIRRMAAKGFTAAQIRHFEAFNW